MGFLARYLVLQGVLHACTHQVSGQRPVIDVVNGDEPIPDGADGVEQSTGTASAKLDQLDGDRYSRVPGAVGAITFAQGAYVDSVQLELYFPEAGSERVTVAREDVYLDSGTVRGLVDGANGDCSASTVLQGTSVRACAVAGGAWYQVTWTVPFLGGCSRDVDLELSGAH